MTEGERIAEELSQIRGLLQDIAGALFHMAAEDESEPKEERYLDGKPK